MKIRRAALLLALFLAGCAASPSAVPTETPRVMTIYFTPAAESWISDVYDCAAQTESLFLSRSDSPADADVLLRVGEPPRISSPVFEIDEMEMVLIVNPKNPIPSLTNAEIAAIFRGQIRNWAEVGGENAEIQVWAYDAESDLQRAFDEAILMGAPPFSMAEQAPSPEKMRSAVAEEDAAVGILSRRDANADVRVIPLNQTPRIPVLAILREPPQGEARAWLACLQR
jgi:hypothetical protein